MGILKRYFVSGVLVVVPIILTYIVLRFLFEAVDGVLQPIIVRVFGYSVPGLGILTTILIIILAGVFTRNIIGAKLYRTGDRILEKMPIIRPIYSAAKQLLEAITLQSIGSFKEVALVEYPRRGAYALCFISNWMEICVDGSPKKYVSVYVPSTPAPATGMVIMVPADEVIPVNMTVEEGIKFLVSGGVASPELIKKKNQALPEQSREVVSETR